MNAKKNAYVKQQKETEKLDNLKITNEEISQLYAFANLSETDKTDLAELVFNVSFILYKSFEDAKA